MRYVAEFEHATADFDIGRSPQLLLVSGGKSEPVDVGSLNGYDGEVRHFLDAISDEADKNVRPTTDTQTVLRATLDDAVDVAIMLETEQYSAECGRRVTITWGVEEPPTH